MFVEEPTTKFHERGLDALTTRELIQLVIGEKEGQALMDQVENLRALGRMTAEELRQIPGIGPKKAIQIVSMFEIARRRQMEHQGVQRVTSAESAYNFLQPLIAEETQEVFVLMTLNRNNEVVKIRKLFAGGVSATVVDPKIVYRHAIADQASGIIISHNHPSGNLNPSQADIQITRKIVHGGKFFDIKVLDHLIVSHRGYFSFADEGMMD